MTDPRLSKRVLEMAERRGYTEAEMLRALDAPFHTWPSDSGEATIHLGGRLALVVVEDGTAVGLCDGDEARARRSQSRGGVPRKKGGNGRRGPNTIAQLIARAEKAGLHRVRESGHYVLEDAQGRKVTVPKTPSDHRSIPNSVAQIRKILGVDLRTAK